MDSPGSMTKCEELITVSLLRKNRAYFKNAFDKYVFKKDIKGIPECMQLNFSVNISLNVFSPFTV